MNHEVMGRIQASGRPRPEEAAFAYLFGEIEDSRLASKIPQTPMQEGVANL